MIKRKKEIVKIPDARTMDSMVEKRFYDTIVDSINEAIRSGDLDRLVEGKVLTETVLDVTILQCTYWQLNEDDLLADIDVTVDLTVKFEDSVEMEIPYGLCVSLWFDTSDNFSCECDGICLTDEKPERDSPMLDRYLVPIFGKDDIERVAEQVWRKYCPEAITNTSLRTPLNLAKTLGLTITRLPLYKKKSTQSILFFTDGEVTVVDDPAPKHGKEPQTHIVIIPANTIVLNTNFPSRDDWSLCIYHECIHFLWHRMFYRLQDKINSDDSLFDWIEMTVSRKNPPQNPLHWMEFQAERGAFALMLPESIARPFIEEIYQNVSRGEKADGYYYNHKGWWAEAAIKALADSLMLKKFRAKARMKQLGYSEAAGSMNYADDRYATPYALSAEYRRQPGDNFSINRAQMLILYKTNEAFRKLMGTGDYVYADGLVVMNDDRCVRITDYGPRLTAWANAHVDLCCLNFPKSYEAEKTIEYTFGSFNSEAKYNEFYDQFLTKGRPMTMKERLEAQEKLMDMIPRSFPAALTYLMKNRVKVEDLSERTGISVSTLSRLRNEERANYSIEQIVLICIGMNLPPWLSEALLDRAHLDIKRYGAFGHYRVLLDCYFMDNVATVQEMLVSNGLPPLSAKGD